MAAVPESSALPASGGPSFDWFEPSPGQVRIRLPERLDLTASTELWHVLPGRLAQRHPKLLEIDATSVRHCDGAGMALLHHLEHDGAQAGARTSVVGLQPQFETLYKSYHAHAEETAAQSPPATAPSLPADVGRIVMDARADFREQVTFLGHILSALVRTLFDRRMMRWQEVFRVFEVAGVNALPIVSLISLLVGLIIAFESAQPLSQFGAQIFIANMIGLIMIRELGPMMTAIMLAGRSASAFAAEIGTMKVNEELNALQTMGLDPVRFLVVQRVVAGVILTPVLTLYSMLMGVLGGVLVMRGLGFPFVAIYHQMVSVVSLGDVIVGMSKGCVFGCIVAFVGCLRGLQTKKGPSAVGESTTRAVVSSILLIIVSDAVFSLLLFVLGK